MNIAVFSPSQNPYSETFIQAHKNGLKGSVFYFYGKGANIHLESNGLVYQEIGLKKEFLYKLKGVKPPTIWQQLAQKLTDLKVQSILIEYGTHAHHLLPLFDFITIDMIVHFHGYDASMHAVINSTDNYQKVFNKAKYIIAVSKAMEVSLLELGCPKEKLVLNTYGPRDLFFKNEAQFSKKQLIAIGRFTDKKAPYYTIFAFEKALKDHPDATLIMAGTGELHNTCVNLVSYLGIEKQVFFPGIIDEKQLLGYFQESRAFIQHSITATSGDMEGTPLAVLEAGAAGLPVIATYHAGITDVVLHDQTGLLCEEHDVTTMSQHIIQLFNDKEKAVVLGTTARLHIKSYFNLEQHLNRIQELLEQNHNP
jgi:colanic acid/amylovoran biosynthesis glycosyltransferase